MMCPIRLLKPQNKGKVEEFIKEIPGRLHTLHEIQKTNVAFYIINSKVLDIATKNDIKNNFESDE